MTRVADIRNAVCTVFGLTPEELVSPCRKVRVARPRQVAMHLSRRMAKKTYPQIAQMFGQGDHTTAIHANRRVASLRDADPAFNARVRECVRAARGEWR